MTRKWILIAWALNFAAYWIIGFSIGGDAMNGQVSNGKYFLTMHGVDTEVSYAVYMYSFIHSMITITSPLWIVAIRVFRIE
jgi:hypothetical protein